MSTSARLNGLIGKYRRDLANINAATSDHYDVLNHGLERELAAAASAIAYLFGEGSLDSGDFGSGRPGIADPFEELGRPDFGSGPYDVPDDNDFVDGFYTDGTFHRTRWETGPDPKWACAWCARCKGPACGVCDEYDC